MSIKPYQQRVIDEKKDLDIKIKSLKDFLSTETFFNLPQDEQLRLGTQFDIMSDYSTILDDRIIHFK